MKHLSSQFVQPPLTRSISCTNPCIGSRAVLLDYTWFSEGSLSVLNDFILTDSDFLLRAALWNCNLPVSSLILLSQAWQVDLSTEFSRNTEGIKRIKKKKDVTWRQEGNLQAYIKTVEIISQHFIPLLDTNLQELDTETRRTVKETHKQEIRKTNLSIFCFASPGILESHSCGWLTCPRAQYGGPAEHVQLIWCHEPPSAPDPCHCWIM